MKKIGTAASLILAATLTLSGQGTAAKKAPDKVAAKPAKVLDLNSASEQELEALPAIGKVKAAAIIKGRPFKAKDELVSKGILSAAEYAKVKDLIIAKQK